MSMILDALTRAERERQLEKQPDLKFVSPEKPNKPSSKRMWLWAACGLLLVNVVVILFVVRSFTGNENDQTLVASAENSNTVEQTTPVINKSHEQSQQTLAQTTSNTVKSSELPSQEQPIILDSRPLAMEAGNELVPELDRPLFYESKQPNAKPTIPKSKQVSTSTKPPISTSKSKGKVSFSSTELSADNAAPIVNKPKLLIDQGYEVNNNITSSQSNVRTSPGSVPNVRDLPEGSRASLNQYEVNVHVFDDNPTSSFVLINMDKYKEGDRIVNNGPLVEAITSEGVVVDYGSGRALLPAK